ncbi:MAG TPA: ABC transporter ATP-binding protein [Magnetospirillaceae bacterium]|nr:ABC transporter ATP-binding protein [Magnetospirillaceae bacterium]
MTPPVLVLDRLRRVLPNGRELFGAVDLSLAPGQFAAITGESGVGKSTLLNLIGGLDVAQEGRILIEGHDLAALDEDGRTLLRRDRIGFVFQAFHILPHLSLWQNVALPLVLQGKSEGARDRAEPLLDAVGLGGRAEERPAVLSGGELQRVAIARAIVHRPALILADEPTGNLDPATATGVLALFRRVVAETGAAIVLVTHSKLAAAEADRVLTLTQTGLADEIL